jgi:redox-sensitive bicupin YhaK (pirin superfamily)
MSVLPTEPVRAASAPRAVLENVLDARPRDIGALQVARVLPSAARRMVGPFVFFDHMGPAELAAGHGLDVRPHPHIGLATVTYLFEGEIVHRDSLGSHQAIRPGDVNWMTAGRGIVHSERTGTELRRHANRLNGLQLWVALPREHEDSAPQFQHHPAGTLPELELEGARIRVLAGTLFGERAPVTTLSPLFYADATLPPGCELAVPADSSERAAYVIEGELECAGERTGPGRMLVFAPGAPVRLSSERGTRIALIGGEPLGPRYLYWNFVASSLERIERAKADWRAGRFPRVPGDETEFIPLPEER